MTRSLFLTLVFLAIFRYGLKSPIVFLVGYVWVDIVTPQHVAYAILPELPVSMIAAVGMLVGLFMLPRNPDVKVRGYSVMITLFAIWMTLSLGWAVVPEAAQGKWSWAIKSVLASAVFPFFIRRREDLEAVLWTIVISGLAHCLPFGAKVLLSGGGYGSEMGLVAGNSGYGEGSTLAMFAVSLIPLIVYLMKHNTIFPQGRLLKLAMPAFIVLCLLCALGTFARTGLVCAAVLGVCMLMGVKRKLPYIVVAAIAIVVLPNIMGDAWESRMRTIGDSTEGSAMGRVGAWLWTLDYVKSHPQGGSFDSYRINVVELQLSNGTTLFARAKAFHSVYFEILGELGYPGLLMYLWMMWLSARSYWATRKFGQRLDLPWLADAGRNLLITLLIFAAGANFVGIGYQSYFYLLAALGAGLINLRQIEARKLGPPRTAWS